MSNKLNEILDEYLRIHVVVALMVSNIGPCSPFYGVIAVRMGARAAHRLVKRLELRRPKYHGVNLCVRKLGICGWFPYHSCKGQWYDPNDMQKGIPQ